MKKGIYPAGASALAPYSPGMYVEATKTLYISGQIGIKADGKLAATIQEQTSIALERMGQVLKEAGMDFENVVSTDVLVTDMANYGAVNETYAKIFTKEAPARAAYAVKELPFNALVEIKAIAVKS